MALGGKAVLLFSWTKKPVIWEAIFHISVMFKGDTDTGQDGHVFLVFFFTFLFLLKMRNKIRIKNATTLS